MGNVAQLTSIAFIYSLYCFSEKRAFASQMCFIDLINWNVIIYIFMCIYKIIGQSCRPDATRYSTSIWRSRSTWNAVLNQAQCLIKMFNLMLLMLNYRYARSMVLECVISYERQCVYRVCNVHILIRKHTKANMPHSITIAVYRRCLSDHSYLICSFVNLLE